MMKKKKMGKKKSSGERKSWIIKCSLTYTGKVIVFGADEEEALDNFEELLWEDEIRNSLDDYEALGDPEENI